ncbi:hypothetical protein SAMN04488690_2616 [Stenotrophomonas indicatrix]|uniref:Uncharacterized protein n=1 Tax=Stenotrophomonas indicatrix TaxID=2045451 RepID=A0A1W1H010_9GAMM|nr:hypothetical protein SAMN04488690_2616 [Stenotrophomonas indicatrix]
MPVDEASKLSHVDEIMLRQVLPLWVQEGRPSSAAFSPNSNDEGNLSVDRRTIIDPKLAFEAYLQRGLKSGGVWGVSVGECHKEGLDCYSDPLDDNAAHALVNFGSASRNESRRIGGRLRDKAHSRGCLHPASDPV